MRKIRSFLPVNTNSHVLLILILFFGYILNAQAQDPSASCAYCNRSASEIAKNGHVPGCKYYTPANSNTKIPNKSNNSTADPLKTLNQGLDLLLQTEDTSTDNAVNDNQKNEEILKKKEEQKAKHSEGMKTFKPIETNTTEKPKSIGTVMGVVSKCIGTNIEINRNGLWQKINCSDLNNQIITSGDTLRTGKDSKIILYTKDEGYIAMFPNTKYTLPNSEDFSLEVINGKIRVFFDKAHKKFEVRVRGGACCAVRGTQVEIIANDDNSAEISLFEGEVEILNTNSNESILKLSPGKKVKINPDGSIDSLGNIIVNDFLDSFEN